MKNFENIQIRYLKTSDDMIEVSKLIYDTDEFIYPTLVGDRVLGSAILAELIKINDTIFCCNNILVALINNQVIGLLVALNRKYEWDSNKIDKIADALNIEVPKGWAHASVNYFNEINTYSNEDTSYISNISVNKDYSNMGVGRLLIEYFVRNSSKKRIGLHVLTNNKPAIHLYEKCGFLKKHIVKGYSINQESIPLAYYMEKVL